MRPRVLVTGAASGLGAALTRSLPGSRRRGAGDRPRRRGGIDLRLDVTSDDDWAAAVAEVERRWGGLDVLVNNAGVAGGGRLDVADDRRVAADHRRSTCFGIVRGMRAFTPLLKRQRSGHVVNVASLAGLVHPAGMAVLQRREGRASVALTETTGHELAAYGIRATRSAPSYFRTNLIDSMTRHATRRSARWSARLVERSPIDRRRHRDRGARGHRPRRRADRCPTRRPARRTPSRWADRPAYDR